MVFLESWKCRSLDRYGTLVMTIIKREDR